LIHYCITDPKYYGNTTTELEKKLKKIIKKNSIDFICFRDKSSPNFHELAKAFRKSLTKEKAFLNGDYLLAAKLHFDGVHLTSTQFDLIQKAKALHLQVIISTHTREEISQAIALGADYVTYSPIFATPNKGIPKGLADLKETIDTIPAKIIALGGITAKEQIQNVENAGAYGFASIRYFID